jgi:hypothetical protein
MVFIPEDYLEHGKRTNHLLLLASWHTPGVLISAPTELVSPDNSGLAMADKMSSKPINPPNRL